MGRAGFALVVLFLINTMNFFDRQVLGTVGEAIRKEWGLSDKALGALGTAFTLIYAFVGLPLGRLSDFMSRKKILAAGVSVWSLLTAASGICQNFTQLFVARLGVGIGEASCAPAANSLIGDLFPAQKRSMAISVFMLGLPIGIALSFFVGGYVAEEYGWREAFYVAAVPGIICAIGAMLMHEPARGATEKHAVGGLKRPGSPYWLILSIPTMWPIIASGALHNFNMYALGSFLAPYMMRFHKVDVAEAGRYVMVAYGFSGIPGLILGGLASDLISRNRGQSARLALSGVMFLLAAPLTYLALREPEGSKTAFLIYMSVGVAMMYVYYSATYSTIQDLVEPSLRGLAMAIYFFAMYLLGASMGPYATGFLSDFFTERAASAAGVAEMTQAALEPFRAQGLRSAMQVIPIFNVILCFCMFGGAATVNKDVARLRDWMADATRGAASGKA